MGSNDGFMHIAFRAIGYPRTSISSTLIGSFFVILSFFIIGIPFQLGFIARCSRHVLLGDNQMPGWDSIDDILKDGSSFFVIGIVYNFLFALVVFVFFAIVLLNPIRENNLVNNIFIYAMIIALFAAYAVIRLMNHLGWINYLHSGDFSEGVNPLNALKTFMAGPGDFTIAMILQWLITLLLALLFFLPPYIVTITSNTIACLWLLLGPVLYFMSLAAAIYIYTRTYCRVKGVEPAYAEDY